VTETTINKRKTREIAEAVKIMRSLSESERLKILYIAKGMLICGKENSGNELRESDNLGDGGGEVVRAQALNVTSRNA
jgi:hypothetical protein